MYISKYLKTLSSRSGVRMKLDVLMSCMHQTDASLVHKSRLYGDVIVINQCDHTDYNEQITEHGHIRMYSTTDRGLTRSRNMAISKSQADICLLCDDDETFSNNYETKIISAYEALPHADVIIFDIENRPKTLGNKVRRLRFPHTMKVSSWQISFRRKPLVHAGVSFDELLGAGTGNGAEEELKFLLDCQKAGLCIYYVPTPIAAVAQTSSTWFSGFNETFFENRGATTRYILGSFLAFLYAVYYIVSKRSLYREHISAKQAFLSTLRGIQQNKIGKLAKQVAKKERVV